MVDESPLTVAQEMANVAYNLSQAEGQKLTADECRQLKALYDRWNIAAAPRIGTRPQPEVGPREDHGAAPAPSREEVWLRIYAALAGALGANGPTARDWADKALEEFDKRFPPK